MDNGDEEELGDTVAAADGEGFGSVVYQTDGNFAAVVGINHADPVGKGDAVFHAESASARDDGDDVPGSGGNGDPGGDQCLFAG